MKQIVEYTLSEGGSIMVETEISDGSGFERASRIGDIVKAAQSFDDALESIKPAAQKIIEKLKDISDPPHEIHVDFGIKLGAKAGALIASADAEANYTIKLIWRRVSA